MATLRPRDGTSQHLFPYSIVWTPIPIITWLLPFIGHMGICSSDGTIHDFAGPYFISVGNFAFGSPTRYLRLDPARATALTIDRGGPVPESVIAAAWDSALDGASAVYRRRMYNFFVDNCHCYVAQFMNAVAYDGPQRWTMVRLATLMFFRGRHVGVGGVLRTWLPFCLLAMALTVGLGIGLS